MSYPYGGGYGGGYSGAGGYPQQQPMPGMPTPGGPPYQGGAPYPGGGGAPYPSGGQNLPYGVQPPGGVPGQLGFGGVESAVRSGPGGPGMPQQGMPQPGMSQPGMPQYGMGTGYNSGPPSGPASYNPPPVAYPAPAAPGGYPTVTAPMGGAGGYPTAGSGGGYGAPGGYGGPPAAQGYPTASAPGGYGAPSAPSAPTQSPAYHTPTPQAGYGGYSQPTPEAGYGGYTQPTPQAGYGGYTHPTPQAGYGGYSQPTGAFPYSVKEQGTVRDHTPFNPEDDSAKLRKAMKGLGTDERAIIDILGFRTNAQRQKLFLQYKTMYGRDLIQDLKSELSGKFEDCVLALMLPPEKYDASELRRAMAGLGTDEDALIEILCTRNNREVQAINAAYKQMYRTSLEQDIAGDTSGHFKRLMISMANGHRDENQAPNMQKAQQDARKLYDAGEKRWGTDESMFNAILASQSFPQLRAVFDEYQKLSKNPIERAIQSEMSGDLAKGMLTIVKVVKNKATYFAEKMYTSMKGLGTDDKTLIRVVVTRCEVDMVQIKEEFQKKYQQSLGAFIRDDTSGDYKRVLLALCGERY